MKQKDFNGNILTDEDHPEILDVYCGGSINFSISKWDIPAFLDFMIRYSISNRLISEKQILDSVSLAKTLK